MLPSSPHHYQKRPAKWGLRDIPFEPAPRWWLEGRWASPPMIGAQVTTSTLRLRWLHPLQGPDATLVARLHLPVMVSGGGLGDASRDSPSRCLIHIVADADAGTEDWKLGSFSRYRGLVVEQLWNRYYYSACVAASEMVQGLLFNS